MKTRQPSNRLHRPPDFLAEALERLKLVPSDLDLPPLDDARNRLQQWLRSHRLTKTVGKPKRARIALRRFRAVLEGSAFNSAPPEIVRAKQFVESVFDGVPEEFYQYLRRHGRSAAEEFNLHAMVVAYENFRWMRQTLRSLSEIGSQIASHETASDRMEEAIAITASVAVTADGTLDVNIHPFYKGLDGIEVGRIRECQNQKCKTLFWAGRTDQVGCSPDCSQAIRDHRHYIAKGKQARRNRRPSSAADKVEKVRQALAEGRTLTREQISKRAKLSLSQVSKSIEDLNKDYDQVKTKRNAAGEWAFYLPHNTKKGKSNHGTL